MNHHCNGYLFFFNTYIRIDSQRPHDRYKKKGYDIADGRARQQKESTPVQDALSNKN